MSDTDYSTRRNFPAAAAPAAAIRAVRHALFASLVVSRFTSRFALLLAALFLLAQMGALSHAAEHLRGDAGSPSGHVCQLCLAAHGLDAPLPAPGATLPAHPAGHAHPVRDGFLSPTPAGPTPRARSPPAA